MINDENLEKIYSSYVSGVELTTKELNSYGFNSTDLTQLIKRGSIERVQRGLYDFISEDELVRYANKLNAMKEYEKARICFEKCYELNSQDLGVAFSLFLKYIYINDYDKALGLYDDLSKFVYGKYRNDINYYLYLLSIATKLPDEYKEIAKNFTINDIKVYSDDKRYKDVSLNNRIRALVLNGQYMYAKSLLNNVDYSNVFNVIENQLLYKVIKAQKDIKKSIINFINEKNYQEVVDILLDMDSRCNLGLSDKDILYIASKILEIKQSSIVPKQEKLTSANFQEVLSANNFDEALKLVILHNEKYNISNDDDAKYLLLNDICDLINELTKDKEQEKAIMKTNITESKTTVKPKEIKPSFSLVISYLTNNDVDNALKCLNQYMKSIDKSKYEFLIIDLIKLSLLEHDMAFIKPMTALTLICRDDYSYDISSYIQEFYICLSQNKLDEARIYMDIISKSNFIGQECILTDGMYQVLEQAEKNFNFIRNNTIIDRSSSNDAISEDITVSYDEEDLMQVDEDVIEDEQKEEYTDVLVENNNQNYKKYIPDPIRKYESSIKEVSKETLDSERRMIEKKHQQLLRQKSVIILKTMDSSKTERIQKIVDEYPDMTYFSIRDGSDERLVLKYKINEFLDVRELYTKAKETFFERKYKECVDYNLQIF